MTVENAEGEKPENPFSTFETSEFNDGAAVEASVEKQEEPKKDDTAAKEPEKQAEGEAQQEADADAKDGDDKKPTVQDRINKAVKEQREAERRALALERRLEELEAKLKPKAEDEAPQEDAAPKPDDFEYGELDPAYTKALARYEARQEFAELRKKDAEERQAEAAAREQTQRLEDMKSRVTKLVEDGSGKYDDFAERVNDPNLPVSQELAAMVLESEAAVDIAYELAADPKALRALQAKGVVAMAREVARLEAKYATKKDDEKPKVTKAPDPPKHMARGAGGRFAVDGSTEDFAAFEAKALAEMGIKH